MLQRGLKNIRKVKVLGYPFAGGQGQSGVELTPAYLQQQEWFKNMTARSDSHVVYEEIKVSDSASNLLASSDSEGYGNSSSDSEEARNIKNVMASSSLLSRATTQALKDGYFPLVLGGDHSQAIGSIHGAKKLYPDAKLLWIDAHIDANTPMSSPSRNAHGMPIAYLSGIVPFYRHWRCMDMERDLCYFGIRSYEEDEEELIRQKRCLVFESKLCHPQNLDNIHRVINAFFMERLRKPVKSESEIDYWVSFDIDGVDGKEFGSTGTCELQGISMDYIRAFMQRFLPRSIGMDFTEVNFELAHNQEMLMNDESTFREIIELIVDSVNLPLKEFEKQNEIGQNLNNSISELKTVERLRQKENVFPLFHSLSQLEEAVETKPVFSAEEFLK